MKYQNIPKSIPKALTYIISLTYKYISKTLQATLCHFYKKNKEKIRHNVLFPCFNN